MGLYCSKQLETTIHQFCEKPYHITFNTVHLKLCKWQQNVGTLWHSEHQQVESSRQRQSEH